MDAASVPAEVASSAKHKEQNKSKRILPTLLGLAVALLIMMPSVAFADNEASTAETNTEVSEFHAAVQPEISNAILDASSSLVQQAKVSNLLDTALSLEGSPYSAAGQAALGESVSMDELQPGDLLFWGSGSGVYHVGIYVEDGTYIHAAGSGKGVRVQSMEYFHPTFAKRVC